MIIQNEEGEDVEVFTADEVAAREAAVRTAAESEFGKTKEQIEKERDEAKTALAARTGEFGQFRQLNEQQLKELSEKDRIIYENGVALAKANEEREASEKRYREAAVDSAIKAKVGDNKELFDEVKKMWDVIAINAETPDEIATKTTMILGALNTSRPDLVASVAGFSSGSYLPPSAAPAAGDSFATTDAGKGLADDLGLSLTPEEAKKKLS